MYLDVKNAIFNFSDVIGSGNSKTYDIEKAPFNVRELEEIVSRRMAIPYIFGEFETLQEGFEIVERLFIYSKYCIVDGVKYYFFSSCSRGISSGAENRKIVISLDNETNKCRISYYAS